jgi:hypothetical protein
MRRLPEMRDRMEIAMYEDVPRIELSRQDSDVEHWEFPLRVVPDWDTQVRRAAAICRLIDRHLDHEARGRCISDHTMLCPRHLCPEQRVQMITNLYDAAR